MQTMIPEARLTNPAFLLPGAMEALLSLGKVVQRAEAARHYDDEALAGLVLAIANVNVWNRLNVATRQVAGQEW